LALSADGICSRNDNGVGWRDGARQHYSIRNIGKKLSLQFFLKIDNLRISVTRIVVVSNLTLPLLGESPDSK